MNAHRKTLSFVPLLLMPLLIVLLLAMPQAVSAASVTPTVIPGADNTDKTCAVVMPGTIELKIEPVPDGSYGANDGMLYVQIVKPSTLAGSDNSFDWTSNIRVLGVVVKDGVDGANFYNYGPDGSTGDMYLTTPLGGDSGVSHISFCYVPPPPSGNLTVKKVLDWNGVEPFVGEAFEICIVGPSPDTTEYCEMLEPVAEGDDWVVEFTWEDLPLGTYTVTEETVLFGWELISITPSDVQVQKDETAGPVTVTNKRLQGALTIEKATNGQDADDPTGPIVPVGSTVTWTYVVTNTGNVTLTAVTISDDKIANLDCPVVTLAPGESTTCTVTGTAAAGQYGNVGSVVGTPPTGPNVTDTDPSHYFGVLPGIALQKLTNGFDADGETGPELVVGDTVTWTYVVSNTGNVTLTNIIVTDDKEGPVCTIPSLAPQTAATCQLTGTVTAGQYANLGAAVGQPEGPDGEPLDETVSDTDPSHYYGEEDIEPTNSPPVDQPAAPKAPVQLHLPVIGVFAVTAAEQPATPGVNAESQPDFLDVPMQIHLPVIGQ
jgi:plastocyanin